MKLSACSAGKAVTFAAMICVSFSSVAKAQITQTLLSDNFGSYSLSGPLDGQGGWFQDSLLTAPIMLSSTTPFAPAVAVNGLNRTGTGQYDGSSYAAARHALSGTLNPNELSIASVDAYAFSANHSSASGLALSSTDASFGTNSIQIYASWYPSQSPEWQVVWQTPNGVASSDFISGSFDEPVHLELIVDGAAGVYYGRVTSPSTGISESPHHPISADQITSLTEVDLFEDFRDPSYLGIDMANVKATTGYSYSVCLLYDPARSVHSGATIPLRFYLCDPSGNDVSASNIVVHAISLVQASTHASEVIQDAGDANPDNDFRFDSGSGPSGGYIFNLKTTGLKTGTYQLSLTAGTDPLVHVLSFQVR